MREREKKGRSAVTAVAQAHLFHALRREGEGGCFCLTRLEEEGRKGE